MYKIFAPADPLTPYIGCYWSLRGSLGHSPSALERIFVGGFSELLFNYTGAYRRTIPGEAGSSRAISFSSIDAQKEHPLTISLQGDVHLVGVHFRPGGLSAFLPIPMRQLTNQVISPAEVFDDTDELEARLYDCSQKTKSQAALLDGFFLEHLNPRASHGRALAIGRKIERGRGQTRVGDLAQELQCSARSIERTFQDHFGFTPKFYARITRFHHALALINHPKRDLSEIAMACGYYDQAHFSHEFRAFSGGTPEQYKADLPGRGPYSDPNHVGFLQDKETVDV
jgi:AraC-like DNA-binding protein